MSVHPRDSKPVNVGNGYVAWVEWQSESRTRFLRNGFAITKVSERHKPTRWRFGKAKHSIPIPAAIGRRLQI